ncbi:hypothetical protein DW814_08245, partial [Parabacteroides distasonis]
SVGYKTPGIVHGEKETQIKMWRNKRRPVKSNEKEMDTISLQSRRLISQKGSVRPIGNVSMLSV